MVASDTWASRDAKDLSERMLDMPTVVPGTAKERFRVSHTIRQPKVLTLFFILFLFFLGHFLFLSACRSLLDTFAIVGRFILITFLLLTLSRRLLYVLLYLSF